jgi:hypothetical protein
VLSTYRVPVWLSTLDTPDDHVWIITDYLGDPSGLVTVLWPSDY